MRIVLIAALGLGLAFFGVTYCTNDRCWLCDGCYELTVEIDSAKPKAIEAVLCEPFGSTEQAQEQLDSVMTFGVMLKKPPSFGDCERPFRGKAITLLIPFTERVFAFGRKRENYSFRTLLVVAQYDGAERVGRILDISKCRQGDKVTVKVP